jgi:hypothetical protein
MFDKADHLPSRGFTDPHEHLPRQRKGITPQLHGRYPDYDVLAEADHWDEVTRRLVLGRVHDVPAFRFFDERERDTLKALCDTLLAQDAEPRIPVLSFVDEKLHENKGAGYQYFDMPTDQEIWRRVARGLDEEARALGEGGTRRRRLGDLQRLARIRARDARRLRGVLLAPVVVERDRLRRACVSSRLRVLR